MDFLRFKKFRIDTPISWDTHRGGWNYVVDILQSEFHTPDGTLLLTAVEDVMKKRKPIEEPWTGFIHQVPRNNLPNFPDLERLFKDQTWLASVKHCQGIYTISNYLKEYLDSQSFPFPINFIPYTVDFEFQEFDYDNFIGNPRNVLFIGEFMRNFQAFSDLKAEGYKKLLLVTETFAKSDIAMSPTVTMLDRLTDKEYDMMLSRNVVFLNLFDAPANTTVVECLARNTPILINKLPGVVDYLGQDYPFYYSSLEEAAEKLNDDRLIQETVTYLQESPNKPKLRKEHFIDAIHTGSIYRSLAIPATQKDQLSKLFDVTIVITSYKRLYNINDLLDALCNQQFKGTFEIILWNNNIENMASLNEISSKYTDLLTIRLIHSTENYYCAMRLAMVHLMQSDYLLICDDDVRPGPNYVATFWAKYHQQQRDVILCARGHVFEQHNLDEQYPEKVWEKHRHIQFYDESVYDTYIHFFHADNCFISKSILLKINGFELENPDFILVDDYWMSYIVSHELGIPILKIQLDSEITFTPCANDKEIALFHNPKVRKERIDFYIYHMRKGWPNSVPDASIPGSAVIRENNGLDAELPKAVVPVAKSIYFKTYDLSVVICFNSNITHLSTLIQSFLEQDFSGTYELIVWNNDVGSVKELDNLYTSYRDLMEIKVIHSDKNYFSVPRIALTGLLRGARVVWCGDHVIPKSNYLSYLYDRHLHSGSNTIVSVAGQSFLATDADTIERPGITEGGMSVNVLNGNSCILTHDLLRKIVTFRMPVFKTTLLQEQWLSDILSQELDTQLVSIESDAIINPVRADIL